MEGGAKGRGRRFVSQAGQRQRRRRKENRVAKKALRPGWDLWWQQRSSTRIRFGRRSRGSSKEKEGSRLPRDQSHRRRAGGRSHQTGTEYYRLVPVLYVAATAQLGSPAAADASASLELLCRSGRILGPSPPFPHYKLGVLVQRCTRTL
jgi:hypothetical protein